MDFSVDTHTHTVLSGHAFSTLLENLEFAARRGLEAIVDSEHTQTIPGTQPNFSVLMQDAFPKEYKGVRLIKGMEANIINTEDNVDVPEKYISLPQFVIASLHGPAYTPASKAEHTDSMIVALNNPYIDIIGHPGNPQYEIDQTAVVLEAKRLGKLLEVNNHSFAIRKGSDENCRGIIRLCKKYGVRICVASDAHICFSVGVFDHAIAVLESEGFPEELIVNRNYKTFADYLCERTRRLG